jgi:hypothetical protein
VTDHNHEEIASRLRDEAAARAPERLRADVMLQVRAEPRPRRIQRRRSYWRPLGTLAAAACVLGALVFGISHVDLSGGGSASVGEAASSGAATSLRAAAGAGATGRSVGDEPGVVSPSAAKASLPAPSLAHSLERNAIRNDRLAQAVSVAPKPLRAALLGRLALTSPLPKALGTLELHRGHGSH